MKYVVTIGTREVEVVVDGDQVEIDGARVTARLEPVAGTPQVAPPSLEISRPVPALTLNCPAGDSARPSPAV